MIIGYYEQSSLGSVYYKLIKCEMDDRFRLECINSFIPKVLPSEVKLLAKKDMLQVHSNNKDFLGEFKVLYFKLNPNLKDLFQYINKCNWNYIAQKEYANNDKPNWFFYLEFNNQKFKINGKGNSPREIFKIIKWLKYISNSNFNYNDEKQDAKDNTHYSFVNMENAKILVIGDSAIRSDVLKAIAKEYGIANDKIDFELDYLRLKKYNFGKLKHSLIYSDIMVGPMPHKVNGLEGCRSFIGKVKNMPSEFPKLTVLDSNSGLKITKESFKNGLKFTELYKYLHKIKDGKENII